MNWDQVEGNWKQIKGKAKQMWANLTDDDLENIAGKRQELAGRAAGQVWPRQGEGRAADRRVDQQAVTRGAS